MSDDLEKAFRAGWQAKTRDVIDTEGRGSIEPALIAFFGRQEVISPATERAKAEHDSQLFGTGFLVDGVRVAPDRVTMIRKAYWPHVTSTELHNDLARVLRDKGASDEWVAYVMGDLQLAATQYAASAWAQGHAAGVRGDPIPNPQGPPDSASERPVEDNDA